MQYNDFQTGQACAWAGDIEKKTPQTGLEVFLTDQGVHTFRNHDQRIRVAQTEHEHP